MSEKEIEKRLNPQSEGSLPIATQGVNKRWNNRGFLGGSFIICSYFWKDAGKVSENGWSQANPKPWEGPWWCQSNSSRPIKWCQSNDVNHIQQLLMKIFALSDFCQLQGWQLVVAPFVRTFTTFDNCTQVIKSLEGTDAIF